MMLSPQVNEVAQVQALSLQIPAPGQEMPCSQASPGSRIPLPQEPPAIHWQEPLQL